MDGSQNGQRVEAVAIRDRIFNGTPPPEIPTKPAGMSDADWDIKRMENAIDAVCAVTGMPREMAYLGL